MMIFNIDLIIIILITKGLIIPAQKHGNDLHRTGKAQGQTKLKNLKFPQKS